MIDPHNIKLNMRPNELQEFALFAISVPGHNADATARCLDRALKLMGWPGIHTSPFRAVMHYSEQHLAMLLQEGGVGRYNAIARTMQELASSGLNLATCTREELESIYGIGPKTSRFFIMYSRPEEADNYAVLDVHILRWMRENLGIDTPKNTPTSHKRYAQLEQQFLSAARERGLSSRDLDTVIWQMNAKK